MIVAELAWFGLTLLTSWSLPSDGQLTRDLVDVNTRPESYAEHYLRNNLLFKDPVIAAMRANFDVLSWSDVRKRGLSRSQLRIIDEGRDFGATDGLTIPVLSSTGCVGVFCPCGLKPDLSERARAALELIGLYAHQELQRAAMRDKRRVAAHRPLTPREREVMRWVAVGKTNDEIGCILGVQGATIKPILARAQLKLDASGRTYAVVQAIRLGELDLNF